jgi:glucose/mannose-6-phosphate isomerase
MAGPVETTDPLGPEAVERVDGSGQLHDILDMPEHLRDALWRVSSANMVGWDSPGGLVVAGMGGSAIGGELARVCLGDQASRPILSARSYGLPPWTAPETTVLCASYSGDTEETLAAFAAAGFLGARRVVVTTGGELAEEARREGVPVIPVPGGFQPRSAVGYMTVAALEVAALCGAGPRIASDIDVTAAHLDELCARWGPDAAADNEAKALAHALHGSVPVIAGAGATSPVAYRWKTQLNENAKTMAVWDELPEASHNTIVGYPQPETTKDHQLHLFLAGAADHPRNTLRAELAAELLEEARIGFETVRLPGETRLEQVVAGIVLGDLVSAYLAVLYATDPTPVDAIVRLKAALAEAAAEGREGASDPTGEDSDPD